ncbi:MAG: 16S rRNA (uracil(1498)-N(3))-methyltransferase [Candidatus Kappaea frigidicola]|nr:16S rRNA (uracil(1498)-N(3))-methyltransferase [Candidatus Kappaea frigidicola]
MSRFFSPPETVKQDIIELGSREAHHISKVMRLKVDDEITVFDGSKEYSGVIQEITSKKMVIKVQSSRTYSLKDVLNITLAIGLPKYKKMDLVIQKATELGVKKIIPLVTQRSIVDFNEKIVTKKIKRWQQIAIAACKQSGRIDIPEITKPLKLKDAINESRNYDVSFTGWVGGKAESLKHYLDSAKVSKDSRIICFIGPEGGFSKNEIDIVCENEIATVSFGQRVLRCETAAMYVLSALSFYLEG